jgi:O-antigen ligase
MVVPESWRIGGLAPFDLLVYPSIGAYCLRRALEKSGSAVDVGFDWAFTGLTVLLLSTIIAYSLTVGDFRSHAPFIQWMGADQPHLFAVVCTYGILRILLLAGARGLGRSIGASTQRTRAAVAVFLIAGATNAVVALLAWFSETGSILGRYNFLPPIEQSQGVHVDRMVFTFIIALSLWMHHRARNSRERFALLATLLLCVTSIVTVLVRMGWVELLLATFLLVVASWNYVLPRVRIGTIAAAVFFVAAGLFVVRGNSDVADSLPVIAQFDSPDIINRRVLVNRAFEVFREHPWVGVGYGQYFFYSTTPVQITSADIYVASAHNGAMMVLAESGIVGTICFVMVAFGLLRDVWRSRVGSPDAFTRGFTASVLAVLVVLLVVHFTSDSSILPIPQERMAAQNAFLLWLLVGICSGIGRAHAHAQTRLTRAPLQARQVARVVA